MENNLYKYIIVILLLLSSYFYVYRLKTEIELLKTDNEILESSNSILVEQVELVNKKILILNNKLNINKMESDKRKNVFDNHDLKKLLTQRSELMEKKINKAIEKTFKRFEE